jgi:hypothetical protein
MPARAGTVGCDLGMPDIEGYIFKSFFVRALSPGWASWASHSSTGCNYLASAYCLKTTPLFPRLTNLNERKMQLSPLPNNIAIVSLYLLLILFKVITRWLLHLKRLTASGLKAACLVLLP